MMQKIKIKLKNHPLTKDLYRCLKDKCDKIIRKKRIRYTGRFVDRSHGFTCLCIVLAGYKEYTYSDVLGRIKKYQKDDMDVCVVSSGVSSEQLDIICARNGWSYLSTKENHVGLVQNVAIAKHPKAKYIFKLDEDIFITENYFDNMLKAYEHAQEGNYVPGVMAPLINVNGYSYAKILEKLNLCNVYEEKFGTFKYATGQTTAIESNAELAKFMWGKEGYVPYIDELNRKFSQEPLCENPCSFRFSIGAILFERKLWDDMGFFSVSKSSTGMGQDEKEIDTFCYLNSRVLMVSENVVVGHLSFGPQNEEMKQFFFAHPENFR